jgi:hypothetical protein
MRLEYQEFRHRFDAPNEREPDQDRALLLKETDSPC